MDNKKVRPMLLKHTIYCKLENLLINICRDILICNNT